MAFIDDITIHAMAGRGGDGVVRWLHIKGHDKAGPAGGDGGRGGDVIIEGVRDLAALSNYQYEKKFRAEPGAPGDNNNKKGKDGEDLILKVPVGTIVTNTTTKESFEILHDGEQKVIFKGGNGGLGNPHFKGAVNQNPIQSTPWASWASRTPVSHLSSTCSPELVQRSEAIPSPLLSLISAKCTGIS
jgi:GTP-binding protein